jgi:hypothetical protein
MDMVLCIGQMGGNGWFAEIDFDNSEAVVMMRDPKGHGNIGPIATVPLGMVSEPEDDDHNPTLDPEDETNKDLMAILAVPQMRAALRLVRDGLMAREGEPRSPRWLDDMRLLGEVNDALMCAETIPE